MKLKTAVNVETVSVNGIEYEVKNGLVELPDDLPGPILKDLTESHGMKIESEESPATKSGKKSKA